MFFEIFFCCLEKGVFFVYFFCMVKIGDIGSNDNIMLDKY